MKNILVVDDNKTSLLSAKNALNDIYRITAVTSGEQAFRFLEKNTPDLVLLDLNMPELDGYQVLEHFRQMENGKDLPVIFLTADNDPLTETKCLEAGALDFIAKPFVPLVMRSRISRALELEDLRKELASKLDKTIQEVSIMKNKSSQDALTGLWNRVYTEDAVNQLFSSGKSGAVFMMDMDNFKLINDNYGHIAGDHVLKMFADTMRTHSTDDDILCRIGGDEFVMFVGGDLPKSALGNRACDMISDIVNKLAECKYETNTTVSVGIAQYPTDGVTFAELYNAADKALYYVKQNGKNAFHFFSEQNEQEASRNANNVDIHYLREIMSRSDAGHGSYIVEFDQFQQIYNFIRRIVERSNRDVQTILFTLDPPASNTDPSEIELANDMLEQAIYTSLRRVDVSTRYSSRQMIVILMDSNTDNGKVVAERILDCFKRIYSGKIDISYSIVKMEGKVTLPQIDRVIK